MVSYDAPSRREDVNRFELRNRNRSTIPIILSTLMGLQKLDMDFKILGNEDIYTKEVN